MIDKAKRNTLKVLSVTAGAAATAGTSLAAVLNNELVITSEGSAPLAEIEVTTRVSVVHNDIEVVMKNTGSHSVTITHMTPRVTRVARGEFNFASLLKKGPLTLAANESVTVPLQRKAVKMWASPNSSSVAMNGSLEEVLRGSVSVVTEGNAFASVTVGDGVHA